MSENAPELSVYELEDGTTVQLTAEDAKRFPGAKKVGGQSKQDSATGTPAAEHRQDVSNRARR